MCDNPPTVAKGCQSNEEMDIDNEVDDEICQELLILANKYNVRKLAEKLLPQFIEKINTTNCIEAYVFGFTHEFEKVKSTAFNFIIFHWDQLQAEESKLKNLSKYFPKEYEFLKNSVEKIGKILHCRQCSFSTVFDSQGKVKVSKCKQCEFVAVGVDTKGDYWKHSKIHIKPEKMLNCPKCPFVTEHKQHLEFHLRPFNSDHDRRLLYYRCSDCNYASIYEHR